MCGIFAVISKSLKLDDPSILQHLEIVKHRGPDYTGTVTLDLGHGYYLHMVSYVLSLRGHELVPQPYRHENGDMLQWNGEIFGGIDIAEHECDTTVLANKLSQCGNEDEICELLQHIKGPWTLVYFNHSSKKLWFGRDYFGRRSMLFKKSGNTLMLSSVAKKSQPDDVSWTQVSADGVYVLDLQELLTTDSFTISCKLWESITIPNQSKSETLKSFCENHENQLLESCNYASNELHILQPPICIYKSNFLVDYPKFDAENLSNLDILSKILDENRHFSETVDNFIKILRHSVEKRVYNVPKKPGSTAPVAVLFSGGIDCTVIALLADEFILKDESIVLFNVAFETPKNNASFDVPDRITGRCAAEELRTLRPNRTWKFVEINVTLSELQTKRKEVISDLTYPLVTVLDDSIGCAIWFATRGVNGLTDCDTKVVLSGLGADEQLGGYSRHRSAFEKDGFDGFEREIMLEIERISSRNLGRDDRIITHHGKEGRFPYLDEDLVSFLNQTPLPYKANFEYKRGLGEKILLRAAGYKLGLKDTAVLPKRAIQFGSRIAKAESRKEKASDLCDRLL